MLERLNIDLLIVVGTLFVFLRFDSFLSVAYSAFFKGIILLVPTDSVTYLRGGSSYPWVSSRMLELLSKVSLSTIKLDNTLQKKYFVTKLQKFFPSFSMILSLTICSVMAQIACLVYNCVRPTKEFSSWSYLLLLVTFYTSSRSVVQVMLLSSRQSFEFKLSIAVGLMTIGLLAIILRINNIDAYQASLFEETATLLTPTTSLFSIHGEMVALGQHVKAILSLVSRSPWNVSLEHIILALYTSAVVLGGVLTACLTLIAYRYSEVFFFFTFPQGGSTQFIKSPEIYGRFIQPRLWLCFLSVFVSGVVLTPTFEMMFINLANRHGWHVAGPDECSNRVTESKMELVCHGSGEELSTTVGLYETQLLLSIQFTVLMLTGMFLFLNTKLHLQGYLDLAAYQLRTALNRLVLPSVTTTTTTTTTTTKTTTSGTTKEMDDRNGGTINAPSALALQSMTPFATQRIKVSQSYLLYHCVTV
jgi:hypothetical protein